ncbi:hypothetical protein [Azospirillum argentinense]
MVIISRDSSTDRPRFARRERSPHACACLPFARRRLKGGGTGTKSGG